MSKGVEPVGLQNKPPQDVPQWYADYLERKATLTAGWGNFSLFNYPEELESVALLIKSYYQRYLLLTCP